MEDVRDLSTFPDAVLIHILGYLPLRDRLRCARVCRRWYPLVQDKVLWRSINLTPYRPSSKVVWHLLRNNLRGSLRTLKARGSLHSLQKKEMFTPALMRALGKLCPNLCHLGLTETDLRLVPYNSIPSSLTNLELISCEISSGWFKVPEAPQSQQAFPRIKHLVIKTVPAFSDEHLLNIAKQGTLQSLVLSETYRLTDLGIKEAAPYMGDLEYLALRRCNTGDLAMHFVGRHMKHLRHLDLGFSSNLTDGGLLFLSSFPNLQQLCLKGCSRLTPEAVVIACQTLSQLKCLDLSGIKGIERTIPDIQTHLPSCVVSNTTSNTDAIV